MSSTTTGATEVWQARIGREFAAQLHADADVLGLDSRTDIVKAALAMLHRSAAEQRMAHNVDAFYGGDIPQLPIGVLPAEDDAAADATDGPRTTRPPTTPPMVRQASGARGHA